MAEDVVVGEAEENEVSLLNDKDDTGNQEGDKPVEDQDSKDEVKPDSKADEKPKDKADEEKKNSAPETYEEFKMPDGVELDKEKLEEFLPVAKELDLSQEKAQKLVDFYAKTVEGFAQQQQQVWADTLKGWREAAVADKEYGGKNFQENLSSARKALDTFGTSELREMLDNTGMGNNPELIRMLVKVGKAVSDDKFVFGKSGDEKPKSAADLFYPTMNKK